MSWIEISSIRWSFVNCWVLFLSKVCEARWSCKGWHNGKYMSVQIGYNVLINKLWAFKNILLWKWLRFEWFEFGDKTVVFGIFSWKDKMYLYFLNTLMIVFFKMDSNLKQCCLTVKKKMVVFKMSMELINLCGFENCKNT